MTEQDKRWQIHRHLAQDTDERLQLVRNAPKRIMLIGADADISRSLLAARYPDAVLKNTIRMLTFENRRRRAQRRFLAEADRQNHPAALPSPDRAIT